MANVTVIPGATAVLRVQVRRYDGSLAVLDGGSSYGTVHASGMVDEAVSQVVSPDAQTRLMVVSSAQTAANPGKQIRVRSFITPADSVETVGSETFINVAPA